MTFFPLGVETINGGLRVVESVDVVDGDAIVNFDGGGELPVPGDTDGGLPPVCCCETGESEQAEGG